MNCVVFDEIKWLCLSMYVNKLILTPFSPFVIISKTSGNVFLTTKPFRILWIMLQYSIQALCNI